jgi:hypothetical protein
MDSTIERADDRQRSAHHKQVARNLGMMDRIKRGDVACSYCTAMRLPNVLRAVKLVRDRPCCVACDRGVAHREASSLVRRRQQLAVVR